MKTTFVAFLTILTINAFGQSSTIKVTIKNIKDKRGEVYIGLFNSQDKGVKSAVQKVVGTELTTKFSNLTDGNYVIKVYQDLNSNKELDKNFIGIPKEPYGLSNNVQPKFAPPAFKDMLFEVKGEKEIVISLN